MRITRILTDNGKEVTERRFGPRRRAASGEHDFDRLCCDLGSEHRLAPPMHPQSEEDQETVQRTVSPRNGMVERCNGHREAVLQSHRYVSAEDLESTLMRYVHLNNTQL